MNGSHSLLSDPVDWVVLSFFVFLLLFGKRLWGAMTVVLDARSSAVRAELTAAENLRAESEIMLRDAQAALVEAHSLADAMVTSAAAEAAHVMAQAHEEIEMLSKQRERMLLEQVAAARTQAAYDVRTAAATVAIAAARRVIAHGDRITLSSNQIDHTIDLIPVIAGSDTVVNRSRP